MARYVDGFVIPISKKKLATYKKMAALSCKVWLEHGALDYVESVGEDLKVKWGATFPRTHKLKAGETIVFSWITYKSRAHRDRVNAAVMKDPRLKDMCSPDTMPFEMKRMLYGGFEVLVSA
ncbi:MAG: DUF1428 domain-containing protein [Opitutaceae bacterium]|nr:DUF1428 domain-containing protein [Opitutaceae bacterium]